MICIPPPGRRARLLALVYGIALFVWFSLEDLALWPVIGFGVGLAALIILFTLSGKLGGKTIAPHYTPVLAVLSGSLTGVGSSIAVVGLMFFKNARHGHLFPDYPVELMLAVLERAPVWALAGGLLGLSVGLGRLALRVHTVRP